MGSVKLFLILVLSIGVQSTAFAGPSTDQKRSCAQQLSGSSPFSSSVQLEPDPKPDKVELQILGSAVANHYSVTGLSEADSQKAIVKFAEIVAPMRMFLFEEEMAQLSNLSPAELQALHQEVFYTNSRSMHTEVANLILSRMNQMAVLFKANKDFRLSVLAKYKEFKASVEREEEIDISFAGRRPQNDDEMQLRFQEYIAFKMLGYSRQKLANKIEDYEESDREVFFHALRKMQWEMNEIELTLHPENLPLTIAKSYVATFDPHSNLDLPMETMRSQQMMASQLGGIGVGITEVPGGILIVDVHEGGPADRAGMKKGDIITHMRGEDIKDLLEQTSSSYGWLRMRHYPIDQARQIFSGEPGTVAEDRVRRGKKFVEIPVTRELIDLGGQKMQVHVVETPKGKMAHVQFNVFYHGAGADMREALSKVIEENEIVGVALDLRQNGGGSVPEIEAIMSLFIPEGPVFQSQLGVGGPVETGGNVIKDNNPVIWDGPMIVMTSPYSASASEAVAANMQDYDRALIVGDERTYGKGSMQVVQPLDKQGIVTIRLTTSLYFVGSGRSPQEVGVVSDIVLKSSTPLRENFKYEADEDGVIETVQVESLMPDIDSHLENKESIIEEVQSRYDERHSQESKTAKDSAAEERKSIFDQQTDDAMEILQDLVEVVGF